MKRRSDDTKKSKAVWTPEEDEALLQAVKDEQIDREAEGDAEDEEEDWDEIAKSIPGKSPVQCFKRYLALSKKTASQPKVAPEESGVDEDSKRPSTESKRSAAVKSDPEEEGKEKDEDEEGEEETGERSSKRARNEGGDAGPSWPEEETDLLKKLVEQYKESKSSQSDREQFIPHSLTVSHV